jgi:hypothetical protein
MGEQLNWFIQTDSPKQQKEVTVDQEISHMTSGNDAVCKSQHRSFHAVWSSLDGMTEKTKFQK